MVYLKKLLFYKVSGGGGGGVQPIPGGGGVGVQMLILETHRNLAHYSSH